MDAKRTIQKILFIFLWVIIGAGMLTLLVAAIGKKNKDRCSGYHITIKGAEQNLFVAENDVLNLLTEAGHKNIKGQLISSIHLRRLETLLEDNDWIKDAQLYFNNQDVLHIIIHEREPVARIFTTEGNSFYIDDEMTRMPLSDKKTAKVPVFTGFSENENYSQEDRALLNDIKTTAVFILKDPFWMAQVSQIDITEAGYFEMIPTVGNHLVKLGSGENIEKKFDRLFIFYKEIVSKAGFEKYPVIDVQYAGQVVATRKDKAKTRVDTTQLRRNVQRLLQEEKKKQEELNDEKESTIEELKIKDDTGDEKQEEEKKIPKAVMPKRDST
jgi:cell division protein FtsQ